ncbi:MAG: helix-turn-helix domain-containing protein, partial [Alphaproteobacteria bacterium]|nr:helix-turn-helix domain-containing protein [Alphaproteobacteria bacterium]
MITQSGSTTWSMPAASWRSASPSSAWARPAPHAACAPSPPTPCGRSRAMSYRHVEMVLNSSISDPTEAAVMIALASHADQYFSCYPSIARLCQLSRYKERAVQNAIKRLQERGVIIVKQGGGRGGASFYTIVPAALNPAADAPISGPKPRTRNTVSDTETPHLIPETPHLMRENPAADAPEPIQEPIQEPQSCASAREAGLNQGRVLRMRKALIEAMGLTGSELNTSGTFVVQKMAPADIELSLDVWSREGLTDEQII